MKNKQSIGDILYNFAFNLIGATAQREYNMKILEEHREIIIRLFDTALQKQAEEIDKEFARLFMEYKLGTRDVIYLDFQEILRKKYLKSKYLKEENDK